MPSGVSGTMMTRPDLRPQTPSGCRERGPGAGGTGPPCSEGQCHAAVSGWGGTWAEETCMAALRGPRRSLGRSGNVEMGAAEGPWLWPRQGPEVALGLGVLAWFRSLRDAQEWAECPLGGIGRL